MAAVGEFARRAGTGVEGEFAADELACELHMSQQSAAGQMDFATEVAKRLPKTFAALAAGQIHPIHLRIIEEATRYPDRRRRRQGRRDPGPGGPRHDLRRTALRRPQAGPQARPRRDEKRKEAARREAHVRRFREESGNAGMVARELPTDQVLACWQHVEQRALDLRAAGDPRHPAGPAGPRLPRPAPRTRHPHRSRRSGPAASGAARPGPACPGQPPPDQPPPAPARPARPVARPPDPAPVPRRPGPGPRSRSAPRSGPGPSLAALVTITIPLTTYQGRSDTPGEAAGYGPLDGDDARDLAAAAARHPRTRWCVTALNPDGTAAAHACLPGRHPPPGTGPPAHRTARHRTARHRAPRHRPPGILATPLTPITRGPCDHAHGQVGYHPTRTLIHLIRARNTTCTAPGCGRPRPAATWTTPPRGIKAAGPANVTWPRRARHNNTLGRASSQARCEAGEVRGPGRTAASAAAVFSRPRRVQPAAARGRWRLAAG